MAILAAAYPDQAPFMADECMLSTPGVETMDYTVAEYLNYAMELKKKSNHLNSLDSSQTWTPHQIELALWAHFVAGSLDQSILSDLPLPEDLPQNNDNDGQEKVKNPPKLRRSRKVLFKMKIQLTQWIVLFPVVERLQMMLLNMLMRIPIRIRATKIMDWSLQQRSVVFNSTFFNQYS
ncbi:uncharacterized protein TNIN_417142 [Trichonephila inaurata madagascariensis]|uniref:Uncharacterized protein n=1 Tax=Trichonephila inaurata madagascariensis TaxID=2747483 RepID=A0A8X7CIF2_9ARAC|nr:uncharacterized protein TNIN_417142 [Trichonephila inaurata madagascariensis]